MDKMYHNMHNMHANLSTIDLNLLSVLDALLDTASVSEAAKRIGRTQSATSHALGRLRNQFGDPLLVRDGWQMQLTPFAVSLKGKVKLAVQGAVRVFEANESFDVASSSHRIRIATRDICAPLFSPLIAAVSQSAPKMSVEFLSSENMRDAVLSSDADIGLGFGELKDDVSLEVISIGELDWAVFAPSDHPFARKSNLENWVNARHLVVAGRDERKGPVEKAIMKAKVQRQVLAYPANFTSAIAMVQECNALFTSLRQPFEPLAEKLGLKVCKPPFRLPHAPAVLTLRAHFGDPFRVWLSKAVHTSLTV